MKCVWKGLTIMNWIAITDNQENMLNEFLNNTLMFLYEQEDKTDYRIKTISRLINEIQDKNLKQEQIPDKLSCVGKRRYNSIYNQILKD